MISQSTFDELRRARARGPETSRASAAAAHGLASDHRARILQVLRDEGHPLAAFEIAARCGCDSVQVSRRLREMVDDGDLVVASGTHTTPSGRQAQTYEVAP